MHVSPFSLSRDRTALSSMQRTLMLKTFPGFATLSAEQLAALAAICHERFFAAESQLCEPGKVAESFYLIVEGEVHIRREGAVVQTLGARSAVGGLAAITLDPAGTDAVATCDVLALEVATQDMNEVFEDNFAMLVGVLLAMARTSRGLQMQLGQPIVDNKHRPPLTRAEELTLVDKVLIMRQATGIGIHEVEPLALLAANTEELRFDRGQLLWKTGEPSHGSYVIVAGHVRCQCPGHDAYEVGPGWVLGAQGTLAMMPRFYRAEAIDAVRVLRFNRDTLLDLLEDYNEIAQHLLRQMAASVTALLGAVLLAQSGQTTSPPVSR